MYLPKGYTTYKYLTAPDPQFDANEMLAVTFTNVGDTIALVNEEEVYPGESFVTPDTVVQTGKFNVNFKPKQNPGPNDKNRVMVKFTRITGILDLTPKADSCT